MCGCDDETRIRVESRARARRDDAKDVMCVW